MKKSELSPGTIVGIGLGSGEYFMRYENLIKAKVLATGVERRYRIYEGRTSYPKRSNDGIEVEILDGEFKGQNRTIISRQCRAPWTEVEESRATIAKTREESDRREAERKEKAKELNERAKSILGDKFNGVSYTRYSVQISMSDFEKLIGAAEGR